MSNVTMPSKHRISGKTQLIALLGSPVSHSKSPGMQNGCFEALGLDLAYLAFDVPIEKVEQAVNALRVLNVRGANVTMPLKRVICGFLDKLSPAAKLAGAVNTIVNDNGVLTGHITDGVGYTLSLADAGIDISGKMMTIAGIGGASTAVAIQAAMQGVTDITLFNQRDEFFDNGYAIVDMLQTKLNCEARLYDLADLDQLRVSMEHSHIFVNGTPVGMEGSVDQSVIPDSSYFHEGLTVTDLIYVPEQTTLLKMAQAAGCNTVSGLGMQLFQGVEAFRLWTGRSMPLDLARALLRA